MVIIACDIDAWGKTYNPSELTIRWHIPSRKEVEFAVELFSSQAEDALEALTSLTSGSSDIKSDGTGKEWSDEVSRNLVLLRLIISGISVLFDPLRIPGGVLVEKTKKGDDADMEDVDGDAETTNGIDVSAIDSSDEPMGEAQDDDVKPTYRYPAGYFFKDTEDPLYVLVHDLRDRVGGILHSVHVFLTSSQEDDVPCFNALYTVLPYSHYPRALYFLLTAIGVPVVVYGCWD